MPEYPTLEATPDDVAARAYKGTVSWALREVERVELNIARAMAAEPQEGWYLSVLRGELGHVRVFLAVLIGANSDLNNFMVAGDGWVAALRALLSEEPAVAPSEPCLHHDLRGNPAHVPGCDDDGRCPHGYFRSGAGSCPMCSA
jgi:hypothetical protein